MFKAMNEQMELLEIDNSAVRRSQIKNLEKIRKERDSKAVRAALEKITKCAETKRGNLLALAVEAAALRATLGEISDACEKVCGRYMPVTRTISRRLFIGDKRRFRFPPKPCGLRTSSRKLRGEGPES